MSESFSKSPTNSVEADSATPVDRVFDDLNVRLFKVTGVLEENVDSLTPLFLDNSVPVLSTDGKTQIGWGAAHYKSGRLIGNLFFDYYCPERFDIEIGANVYADVVWTPVLSATAEITTLKLDRIILTMKDNGLPPLSEVSLDE